MWNDTSSSTIGGYDSPRFQTLDATSIPRNALLTSCSSGTVVLETNERPCGEKEVGRRSARYVTAALLLLLTIWTQGQEVDYPRRRAMLWRWCRGNEVAGGGGGAGPEAERSGCFVGCHGWGVGHNYNLGEHLRFTGSGVNVLRENSTRLEAMQTATSFRARRAFAPELAGASGRSAFSQCNDKFVSK